MATKKIKKVVLKNRYDEDRRAELNTLKNKVTAEAEYRLGLGGISKTRAHFWGRWGLERALGKLNDMFEFEDEAEGLGHYKAHLTWFAVTKDGKDPKIAVKIDVITIEEEDGHKVYNNTRPTYYDVVWSENVIDAINDLFDKLEDAISIAEQIDYNRLPENLKG